MRPIVTTEPKMMTLGDYRLMRGLTQAKLARAAGCSTPTIARLEYGGIRRPQPRIFLKLAEAYGLTPEDFLRAIDQQHNTEATNAGTHRRSGDVVSRKGAGRRGPVARPRHAKTPADRGGNPRRGG